MKRILIAATAAFVLAAPLAAQADPGHGKDKGDHGTPPGLAKKPYGMPPGQAKKMWSRGERLPTVYITERYYVVEPYRYHLPPAPYGYRWVRVDDQDYLAQTRTGLIAQGVSALLR